MSQLSKKSHTVADGIRNVLRGLFKEIAILGFISVVRLGFFIRPISPCVFMPIALGVHTIQIDMMNVTDCRTMCASTARIQALFSCGHLGVTRALNDQ